MANVSALLAWLLANFGGWLAAGGAAAVAVLVAFLKGRSAGKSAEQAKQAKRRLDAINDRKGVDDEVDQMDGSDLDRNYDRWVRDDKR